MTVPRLGKSAPLQNRVLPDGSVWAIPERGECMGNRGIIHDPLTRLLLPRRWSTKAWIICSLHWKQVRRAVWSRRSWTELFFLDEATALAAGHRPCFYCRREAALSFQNAWATGAGGDRPKAPQMDAVLHKERLQPIQSPQRCLNVEESLPEGAMVWQRGEFYLMAAGRFWRWTPSGYEETQARLAEPRLLTPPATVKALRGGYRPLLHASLARWLEPVGR